MKPITFVFFCWSQLIFAGPHMIHAEVTKVKGKVYLNTHPLKKGIKIERGGEITTKDKSFVKIYSPTTHSTITIGPNSSMSFKWDKAVKKNHQLMQSLYTLQKGFCRWVSKGKPKGDGPKILTKTAVMGVRGTDFYASYNPLLEETEIAMFDGIVEFKSATGNQKKVITQGMWGGLGGRYGEKMKTLNITPQVLKFFKDATYF